MLHLKKQKMTITEKILAEKSGNPFVRPGDIIWSDIDFLLTHDVCGPGTFSIFKEKFGENASVFDPKKVVLIPDHYIFTENKHAQRNLQLIRDFANEQKLPYFYDAHSENYKGVCHVALAEEGFCMPGSTLLGTDSHTCTAGAFGMFATGVGNTDAAFVLGTGKLWLKVPETMKFVFKGKIPKHVMAKDLILKIIGDIGVDGGTYKNLEISGELISDLNMEERMSLCNMAIECGGKSAIIEADEKTREYLKGNEKGPFKIYRSDPDYPYNFKREYSGEDLKALVAKPHSPDNVSPAEELGHEVLTRAYIGSCTGGKLTDFLAAAKVLKGQKVVIDTFVVPATTQVDRELKTTYLGNKNLHDIFLESGAKMGKPSCAACLGGPEDTFGRANDAQRVISTTNRNFPGRMGSRQAEVFLASPYTVAASALTGKVTDPREFIQ
ncbi:MAG: aconitase/3-isopropylmalate dehydratase large subunit family protein [Bdellovibrionota bacterium]|nr:aconitase/3-isopropylmalate dehydratase large subunit family protein [Bdellovibrionota bacterium]